MADRVVVMYAGQIVEEGPVVELFGNPLHPYTNGLLHSIPRLDGDRGRLHVIDGTVPNLLKLPPGCRFAPRCERATERCHAEAPSLGEYSPGRYVACWLHGDADGGVAS
jgi:oligopeptide/dipeptide ABC transporter ATP-binding protein